MWSLGFAIYTICKEGEKLQFKHVQKLCYATLCYDIKYDQSESEYSALLGSGMVQKLIFQDDAGGHLGFLVQMTLQSQTDVNIGIFEVDLPQKVSSYIMLGALVQS